MAEPWTSDDLPPATSFGATDWLRIICRAVPLVIVLFGGLLVLLLIRLLERPLYGLRRPVTPFIVQYVSRGALFLLGLRFHTVGCPMRSGGAIVANHASWLDIFALNARKRIYFVAKSEVSGWAGIGFLARAAGTLFIRRDPRAAREHIALFKSRLAVGHRLLFFPEGTSTDGRRVLPFKPTLFAAFLDPALRDSIAIQPVSVVYHAPAGADPRFYGWWGDMEFAPHLLTILAAKRQGGVTVIYHPPVQAAAFTDRKVLAKRLENTVRSGLADHCGAQIA